MTSTRVLFAALAVCIWSVPAAAQITVTAPTSVVNVKAGDDFATVKFQDPWDMKQNTDLGWHIWSNDAPATGIGSVAFNQPATSSTPNGTDYFHGVSTNAAPNIQLLQSSNGFSAGLGRTGDLYPIDADQFTMLSYRLCANGGGTVARKSSGFTSADTQSVAYVVYAPGEAGQGIAAKGPVFTFAGCQIYTIDMKTLGLVVGTAPWSGILHYLELDPTHLSGVTMDFDWIRLVKPDASGVKTVTWTGGAADIYLDNDTSAANGNLGMLYKGNATNALSSLAIAQGSGSGGSYSFDMSTLSPGQYFFAVCPTGQAETSSNCKYSAAINVNATPTITVTSPSEEGSTDDFATVQLGNAWDFNALTDIDYYQNIQNLRIDTAFPAQRPDGTDLGNVRVVRGTSNAAGATGAGDPYFYTLWFAGTGRGVTKKIDADRYRILTVDMGLPGARDINTGSISRLVWKRTDEANENVSQDIIINHRAGVNILDRINVDMKTLARESDPSLGALGWGGQIENFRFDPHEFPTATDFWVQQIKLTAFETIGSNNSYTIRWIASDVFDSPNATGAKVTASYQPANAAGTAPTGPITAIAGCTAVPAATASCTWSTGTVATGMYYVLLTIDDGVNSNTAYAKYPVIVDPAATPKPRMFLERNLLNFGGHNNNGLSITTTPPQQVRLTFTGTGASTTPWTITKAGAQPTLFNVSPSSGTGPAVLTISIANNTGIPNNLNGPLGTVVVNAANADNTPQSITVNLAMTATTANPFGGFDTPADGATLQGSVAVTGWALDDIGVTRVQIFRDAHPSDPPAAVQNGRIFVGDATIVDGARSDIVALYPNAAANYNAGWGYLMLTRGLIWDSATPSPFKLYAVATDVEGHVVDLGSKTVRVNNSTAAVPFGAIDSPAQGATVSGNLPNTGWVLSPGTTVPASGIQVAVDGVFLSSPVLLQGNNYTMQDRSDITAGFPGFNTTGAGRGNVIDTTVFSDAVHTIGWLVTDSLGRADGVGSRFFKTANASLVATTADATPRLAGSSTAFARLGDTVDAITAPRAVTPLSFGVGMTPTPVFRRASTALGHSEVRVREMERVVVKMTGARDAKATYSAYRVVDGRLRFLPIGASFDTREGTLYWQPAPGFIGDFDFVIVKNRDRKDVSQASVRVTVGPSTATLRAGLFKPAFTIAAQDR